VAALIAVGCLVGVEGCAAFRPHPYEATASLPPDELAKGRLVTVDVGGQLVEGGVRSMPVSGVGRDASGQPYIDVGLAPSAPGGAPVNYLLHLGETITVDGTKVTLVSFDNHYDVQAVTFLVNG